MKNTISNEYRSFLFLIFELTILYCMHPEINFFQQSCAHKFAEINMKYQYYFSFTFLFEHVLLDKINGRHKIS